LNYRPLKNLPCGGVLDIYIRASTVGHPAPCSPWPPCYLSPTHTEIKLCPYQPGLDKIHKEDYY